MDSMQHWFARTWARMILKTAGIHVHSEGLDHIDPAQPAVYASNHLSALDIPVLYASLPTQFRILAKRELFRYPFLGWHLTRSGTNPHRSGRCSRFAARAQPRQRLPAQRHAAGDLPRGRTLA